MPVVANIICNLTQCAKYVFNHVILFADRNPAHAEDDFAPVEKYMQEQLPHVTNNNRKREVVDQFDSKKSVGRKKIAETPLRPANRQQNYDILCTSMNVDIPSHCTKLYELCIISEQPVSKNHQAFKAVDLKKGGTVSIMLGNSGLLYQMAFTENAAELLQSSSTTDNSMHSILQRGAFFCYNDPKITYESILLLLIKKRFNFDILAAILEYKHEMVTDVLEKRFIGFSYNYAGISLNRDITSNYIYIHNQLCPSKTEQEYAQEEKNSNDPSEKALSSSQQKGNSRVNAEEIVAFIKQKTGHGMIRRDIGANDGNEYSRYSMLFL